MKTERGPLSRPSFGIPGWIRQRRVLLRLPCRAARVASSPTLARRFPVGPGDCTSTRWYLHCPYCLKSLPDHLLSAVPARYRSARLPQEDAQLQPAVERDRDTEERGVGLPRRRVRGELVGVEDDVVGDHERARLEPLSREHEQLLVEPVRRVEEDDVEHVVDGGQRLAGVALDEERRLLETGLGDVPAPVGAAALLALQRKDGTAELADSGGAPDRRQAAPRSDLEHLPVGLRRAER